MYIVNTMYVYFIACSWFIVISNLWFQTFAEDEEKKSLSVPIINDNQYEADVDFYVILKNAAGTAGIGDPSVARITIIDDDGESVHLTGSKT